MAVTTQESVEYANIFTTEPVVMTQPDQWLGRLRIATFVHDQVGAGDVLSTIALVKLPPGRVRLLGALSRAYINWTTAVATIDIGWDAYTGKDGVAVVADPDGLDNGLDVELAGAVGLCSVQAANANVKVFESQTGVVIRAKSISTAIIAGDDIEGYLVFIAEG